MPLSNILARDDRDGGALQGGSLPRNEGYSHNQDHFLPGDMSQDNTISSENQSKALTAVAQVLPQQRFNQLVSQQRISRQTGQESAFKYTRDESAALTRRLGDDTFANIQNMFNNNTTVTVPTVPTRILNNSIDSVGGKSQQSSTKLMDRKVRNSDQGLKMVVCKKSTEETRDRIEMGSSSTEQQSQTSGAKKKVAKKLSNTSVTTSTKGSKKPSKEGEKREGEKLKRKNGGK